MMQFLGKCSRNWLGMFAIIFAVVVLSAPTMAQVDPFPPEAWHNVYDSTYGNDYGAGVAIDNQYNVIVAGYRANAVPSEKNDAYARKYNPSGGFLCEIAMKGPNGSLETGDSFNGVAVDSQDNIVVAGSISGNYDQPGGPYYVAAYLNKYGQDCNPEWAAPVIFVNPSDSAWQGMNSVTLDTNDNIFATGSVMGDWDLLQHEWATWKYDTNGILQSGFPIYYNYSTSTSYVDYSYDVAVDSLGNIIVVGIRGQGVGNYDWHVRKYNSTGTLLWSDTYAGTANLADYAYRVAVDSQNHPVVVGFTNKGTDNSANVNYDWLIIKYAVDGVGGVGQRLWTKTYESASGRSEAAQSVAIDGNDNIIVGGYVKDDAGNLGGRLALLDKTNGDTLGERIITNPAHAIPMRLAYQNGAIAIGGYIYDPAGTNHDMYAALLGYDITPDPFTFTDRTDVTLTTLVESNAITVTGIDHPSPVSIIGGEYSINGGAYASTAGIVNAGQTVKVRQTSSSSLSTTTNATLTIGGVSDTFSVTTVAAIAPTIPISGATFDTCSYFAPPPFSWALNQSFEKLELQFFTPANPTKPTKVKMKDPTATNFPMTDKTWKKILKLPGLSGGQVNWKLVGTNKGQPAVESAAFTMTIAAPESAGKPDISPVSQTSLPTLTWGNSCGTKFKATFGSDANFTKKKKLSFTDQGPVNPGDVFTAPLTDKTWIAIRKLVNDVAGSTIYFYVESWDILKRYQKTSDAYFTLEP